MRQYIKSSLLAISISLATLSAFAAPLNLPTHHALASNPSASNQTAQQIKQAVYAYLVRTNPNGEEQLIPMTPNTPIARGDIVEYHAHFSNSTPDRVRSMTAIMAIPAGMELIGIDPINAIASTDLINYANIPVRINPNGQVQYPPMHNYRAVHWTIQDIGINGTAITKMRTQMR